MFPDCPRLRLPQASGRGSLSSGTHTPQATIVVIESREPVVTTDISTVEIVFRLVPLVILAGTGLMGAIVVLNNLTAPGANLAFVRHIMTMDTTNMDSGTQWREIRSPRLHWAAFAFILVCEVAVTVCAVLGTIFLAMNLGAPAGDWEAAKLFAYLSYLLALVVWFVVIQVIGAEWFVSWQSDRWNAIRDSMRINLVTLAGLILLRLA